MSRVFLRLTLAASCVGLLPAVVFAQGGLSGVVRDTSGGVLPGVTVEASSPALIERVRTATTDERGQYSIVNLRPGPYAVTFTLPGFATFKREGLELSAGVTLPLNAELKVGTLEETVIVSSETPVVDVQNTRVQAVVNRDVLDAIPRTRQMGGTGNLLPGVSLTAAVSQSNMGGGASGSVVELATHGSLGPDCSDQVMALDGMKIFEGGCGARRFGLTADTAVQEYTYETSGLSAEFPNGGVRINLVPKEGGNTFKGIGFVAATTANMVADNLTAELKARGAPNGNEVKKIWDVSPALGGPLRRDRLWFFGTYRSNGRDELPPGAFYLNDPTQLALLGSSSWDANARLTWQVSPRNKINVFHEHYFLNTPYLSLSNLIPPEAARHQSAPLNHTTQVKWNSPVTSRVLVEAGSFYYRQAQVNRPTDVSAFSFSNGPRPADPAAWPAQEISTGKWIGGAAVTSFSEADASWWGLNGALSYVSGSHNMKVGFTHVEGAWRMNTEAVPPVLRFNTGVPFQVQLLSSRDSYPRANHDLGLYAQDLWTRARLTLNLGLRFDYFNGQVDQQNLPAEYWLVPVRHLDVIPDVPNWKDISPRFGVAYDLFGNGKTAVKTSLSRYVASEATNFANAANPLGASSTDTRLWTDRNNDRLPQLDELGPSTNLNFAQPFLSTRYDDSVRLGWGKRGYNWEYAATIQQELRPGLALNVGYFRRSFGNIRWTNNTLLSPSDYTAFTFVSPLDGSLITSYNLIAAKRGQSNNLIIYAPNNSQVFNGVDFVVSGKFGHGGVANGGITMGRTVTNKCTAFDTNALRFCNVTPDWTKQNLYKFLMTYPLPYGVRLSAAFTSDTGPLVSANYTVTSAIAGVPLTQGSFTVNLVEPGKLYGDRLNRLDLRFRKTIRGRGIQFEPFVDLLNVLNASPVVVQNNTYGPAWQQPTQIQVGRMLSVGMQVNF
jgi:hypothetical protein